jgi:hypothetical protein
MATSGALERSVEETMDILAWHTTTEIKKTTKTLE